MAKRCRYIPFDRLRERCALLEKANVLGALPPDAFLDSVPEIVDPAATTSHQAFAEWRGRPSPRPRSS
jgi:hypothetical protein